LKTPVKEDEIKLCVCVYVEVCRRNAHKETNKETQVHGRILSQERKFMVEDRGWVGRKSFKNALVQPPLCEHFKRDRVVPAVGMANEHQRKIL
jgi:hypothetical protein